MSAFDPYYEWLDIDPDEQPADHYRLLGLARFETDLARIERTADERMAHLRQFQTGPRGSITQKLLNELASARLCLLDAERKAQYDAGLAQRISTVEAARREATPPNITTVPPVPSVPAPVSTGVRARKSSGWLSPLLIGTCLLAALLVASALVVSHLQFRPALPQFKAVKTQSERASRTRKLATVLVEQSASGSIEFDTQTTETISGFHEAVWQFQVYKPGFFQAEVTYATAESFGEGELELRVDDRRRNLTLRATGGLSAFETEVVTVVVPRSGRHTLTVRAVGVAAADGLAVRGIRFVPVDRETPP